MRQQCQGKIVAMRQYILEQRKKQVVFDFQVLR